MAIIVCHFVHCIRYYSDYAGDIVWQRLGDLSGDALALGVNKESFNTTQTSLFIAQLRSRTFHKAYGLDVSLSAVLDRPPRLSKKHSDCPLPLELTDEELCADTPVNDILALVDADGWAISGSAAACETTWARTRSMFSELREEVSECCYQAPSPELYGRLKYVLPQHCLI
jgi:hypothetical protein